MADQHNIVIDDKDDQLSMVDNVEIDSEEATANEALISTETFKIGDKKYIESVGRRKRASARIRLYDGSSPFDITINGQKYKDYFKNIELIKIVETPLSKLKLISNFKVKCLVRGGGYRGQAEAISLGIARALVKINNQWRSTLKKANLLTRDSREVERKKYGKRKARKREQWQKR
ncbi:MAG: 30S ribosomal protein S9 [Candidatus Parcubacteria bacterium]|nr:MAG: 30S ribosomal protein S9 [Candidatus Parcubacteria bacterium]